MTWKSTHGKSGLIRLLMQNGFSARKAEKAVNSIFASMAGALRRGEPVEVPGGWMKATRDTTPARGVQHRFRDIRTRETRFKIVRYGEKGRIIRFRPDRNFRIDPPPPQPDPQAVRDAAAYQRAAQLAADLLHERVDRVTVGTLLQHCPGGVHRLVRCLEELQRRGRKYPNVWVLAAWAAGLTHIR